MPEPRTPDSLGLLLDLLDDLIYHVRDIKDRDELREKLFAFEAKARAEMDEAEAEEWHDPYHGGIPWPHPGASE